jgi:hypothetical protein
MQTDAVAPTVPATDAGFSNAQPVRHFVVLSVVSLGLYPPYWLYRNLKLLKAHKGLSISPMWRTFFAFVPVLGWPIFKDQLQLFAETAESAGVASAIAPWPHTLGYQLVSAVAWVVPMPWSVLGNAGVIFLLPAQRTLNAYWAAEQPGRVTRTDYSSGEVVFAVVCAIIWGVLLAALFIGEGIVAPSA